MAAARQQSLLQTKCQINRLKEGIVPILDNDSEQVSYEKIVVLIENNTEYITSNCGKLQLEFFLEQGISQSHYELETPELFGYLRYFLVDSVCLEGFNNISAVAKSSIDSSLYDT